MRATALVIALGCTASVAGCGRIGFEPGRAVIGDGGPEDDAPADATFAAESYIKPQITGAGDFFGFSVALSGDGSTLAIGAHGESSNATGAGGDPGDNSAPLAGAVYVYVRGSGAWVPQAYLKASNTGAADRFGHAIALSRSGNTLVIGAPGEDSAATIVDGDGTDNSAVNAGATYVFTRVGTSWSQQAYLKASNSETGDEFGYAVAIAGDGTVAAIGARGDDAGALGTTGNANNSGAVYVFAVSSTVWFEQALLKASNAGADDLFGVSIAMSEVGTVVAVGAIGEASRAAGVNGDQLDDSRDQAGAVYTFVRSFGTSWVQDSYFKASNPDGGDFFGSAIALSASGDTLAVGAPGEDGDGRGVDPPQAEGHGQSGAVYVFSREVTGWSQEVYLKATNTDPGDEFGHSVALAASGDLLVVGGTHEDSAARGFGGDASDNTASDSGAIYEYRRSGAWTATRYGKATNTGAGDQFGHSVAVSQAGTIAVGAFREDSANGDPANDDAVDSGAVYVYE